MYLTVQLLLDTSIHTRPDLWDWANRLSTQCINQSNFLFQPGGRDIQWNGKLIAAAHQNGICSSLFLYTTYIIRLCEYVNCIFAVIIIISYQTILLLVDANKTDCVQNGAQGTERNNTEVNDKVCCDIIHFRLLRWVVLMVHNKYIMPTTTTIIVTIVNPQ